MRVEHWLPIPGWEGVYEVSSLGRVRSLPGYRRKVAVLRLTPAGRGYLRFSACVNGGQQGLYVHHVVAAAFHGPRPDGLDVCHCNGDLTDNRPENLRYDTANGNMRDAVAHGRNYYAVRDECSKGHSLLDPGNVRTEITFGTDGQARHARRCRTCAAIYSANYRKRLVTVV